MDERRKFFRAATGEGEDVKFFLETAAGDVFAGDLLEASFDGVEVRFPRTKTPTLAIGGRAMITIESTHTQASMRLKTKVKHRGEKETFRHYSLLFFEPEKLGEKFPQELLRLFNRRSAYRAQPVPGEPIEIVLRSGKHQVIGRLRDISATGICALVGPDADIAIAAVEQVETSFRLPPSEKTLKLEAWIRWRHINGLALAYGLQFHPESIKRYEAEVLDYIMRCQRRTLQKN
jgi:hypothetical protein